MRVTIIVDDNRVYVNGCAETVDCSALSGRSIHAMQWYDAWGEVEYAIDLQTGNRKPNERITDFSLFQPYQDAWQAEARKLLPGATANDNLAPATSSASS